MKTSTNRNLFLSITLAVLVPFAVAASSLTIPNVFTPNTPIKAAEVNENFAAVQSALNSKLDAAAASVSSGTRLKIVGHRTADGLALPAANGPLFDSSLGVYCSPRTASDGLERCLPNSSTFATYSSDPGCTQPIYQLSKLNLVPGLPVPTSAYVVDFTIVNGTFVQVISGLQPYTGTVYSNEGGGFFGDLDGGSATFDAGFPGCVPVTPSVPVYSKGAVVPASAFVQLNATAL